MKQKIMDKLIRYFWILTMIGFSIAVTSCNVKENTEVIGFPKSFADLAEKVKPVLFLIKRGEQTLFISISVS